MTDEGPADDAPGSAADQLVTEIRRRRLVLGLSQREVARRCGHTREYVSMAERRGANLPSQELVGALDHLLGADGALMALRELAKTEQREMRQRNPSGNRRRDCATFNAVEPKLGFVSSATTRPDDDVNRKTFLRTALGMGAGAVAARHFSEHDASDLAAAIAGPTTHYRRMESTVPTPELVPAVEAHLRLASRVVADSLPTAVGFGVLSETAGLAAWLAADRGEAGTARKHYSQAHHYAEQANHSLLATYMLASLGHFAVESGDPRQGLPLLDRAQHQIDGKDVSDNARAWLASLQSLAYAAMEDRPAALAKLRAAETLSESDRGDPQWPWVFPFDASKMARYQASTLARLGDLTGARSAFEDAAPALTSPKPRALAQVDHARLLAHAGFVEEACALAVDALTVGQRYGSERVTRGVQEMRALLPATGEGVAELDEQLTSLYLEN